MITFSMNFKMNSITSLYFGVKKETHFTIEKGNRKTFFKGKNIAEEIN